MQIFKIIPVIDQKVTIGVICGSSGKRYKMWMHNGIRQNDWILKIRSVFRVFLPSTLSMENVEPGNQLGTHSSTTV